MPVFLKNQCSACGGKIEFPDEYLGESTPCPHCSATVVLSAPLPSPPLPPPARRPDKHLSATTPFIQGGEKPNYVAESVAYDKEVTKAGWKPAAKTGNPVVKTELMQAGGSLLRSIGQIAGTVFAIGSIIWMVFLNTDSGAEGLIKSSMQETLSKISGLRQPIKIMKITLHDGPDSSRTGTAIISCGGKTLSADFTATITHSGRKLEAKWEMAVQEVQKLR